MLITNYKKMQKELYYNNYYNNFLVNFTKKKLEELLKNEFKKIQYKYLKKNDNVTINLNGYNLTLKVEESERVFNNDINDFINIITKVSFF